MYLGEAYAPCKSWIPRDAAPEFIVLRFTHPINERTTDSRITAVDPKHTPYGVLDSLILYPRRNPNLSTYSNVVRLTYAVEYNNDAAACGCGILNDLRLSTTNVVHHRIVMLHEYVETQVWL